MSTLNDLMHQLGDDGALNDRMMQYLANGGGGGGAPALQNVLTRSLFRSQTAQSIGADHTSHGVMEVESHFVGFRLMLNNWHSEPIPNVKVSVALLESAYNVNEPWLVELNPTTDWIDLPAISLAAGAQTFTDWVYLRSLERTDGGVRPLIMYRIEVPSASGFINVPSIGYGGWRQPTSPRYFRTSYQDVLGVTTPASYTQTLSNELGSIVPGIQYISRSAGFMVAACGDSTVEGTGADPRGFAAPMKCVYDSLSTPERPVEFFNLGAAGQAPEAYAFHLPTVINDFQINVAIYSPYSINGMPSGGGGFTDEQWENVFGSMAHVISTQRIREGKTKLILLEGLPVNTAGKDIGAGDADRLELNELINSMTGPVTVPGYADAISGTVSGGQVQIDSGMTSDNIHPNPAGYEALAEVLLPVLESQL